MTTTNKPTKETENKCEHCDDCKNGACCSDCAPGETCVCENGVCTCKPAEESPLRHAIQEVKEDIKEEIEEIEEKFEKSMSGPQSSWKWFFLIGILGLIIGILAGRSMGKAAAHRAMDHMGAHDMRSMMQAMNTELEGKTGSELEKAFLEQMIIHHEGALEMSQLLKAGTDDAQLRSFADDIIQAQSKEIGMMEVWLKDRKGE